MTMLEIDDKPANGSSRGLFFDQKPGALYLDDGSEFAGFMPKNQTGSYPGEPVFNTGMTGYVESLTDLSYARQILTFTYPLIGNYGVNLAAQESSKIQVNGVIVSQASQSFVAWLQSQNVAIISGVDTRALTKHLRVLGPTVGAISDHRPKFEKPYPKPAVDSVTEPVDYNTQHKKTIILVDCGVKQNIINNLLDLPARVRRVPAGYDYSGQNYDAVLLSNGPGDPEDYQATIAITKKALASNKPIFGICLGSQIMGLAAGAKTYKLPFGHRGHNQPCMELATQHCYITSQNHGYAVDEKSLPSDWQVSFRNLNDNSVEGIEHATKPFFSVQFHPEACPGPTDTKYLFDKFRRAINI